MVDFIGASISFFENNMAWAFSAWFVLLLGFSMTEIDEETSSIIVTFGLLPKRGKIVGRKLGPLVLTGSFMLLGLVSTSVEWIFHNWIIGSLPSITVLGLLYLVATIGSHLAPDMNVGIWSAINFLASIILISAPYLPSLLF
jgi:hypothetical protein